MKISSHSGRYLARAEFLEVLRPVTDRDAVAWMRSQKHHISVTVLDHSLFVAYVAYLLARRMDGCDPVLSARAGFLHDLYMYDPKVKGSHEGTQCFAHPEAALSNACRLFPWLSDKEKNAIAAHMFPLARHLPRCREAWAVSLADKFCAVLEGLQLYRMGIVKRRRPDSAEVMAFLVPA